MKHKGFLVKHYFGPAAGENISIHWFERAIPTTTWLNLGLKEGIEIRSDGDVFGFVAKVKPHNIKYLY